MKIGEFNNKYPLTLIPYPNGGWSIEQNLYIPGQGGERLGCYSNAKDMLDALQNELTGDDAE